MKNALEIHIERLGRRIGNFSNISHHLNISARTLRRGRNGAGIPASTKRLIIVSSKLLSLQLIIRELVRSGEVSTDTLAKAWRKTHTG